MEESPINDPGKAGKTEQQGAENNAPKSGERSEQGTAPAPDHYRPDPQNERDQMPIPAPDNVGAKLHNPVLAQPTEEFTGLKLENRMKIAAGVQAVIKSMEFNWGEAGLTRGTHGLLKMNQKDGFDCSSCAWPDPDDHRSVAEFC